jgi:hypothetical protein
MNSLLKLAIEAHGRVDRWNHLKSLKADLSVTGDWVCDSHLTKGEDVKSARATHEAYAARMFAAAAWKSISFLSLAAS